MVAFGRSKAKILVSIPETPFAEGYGSRDTDDGPEPSTANTEDASSIRASTASRSFFRKKKPHSPDAGSQLGSRRSSFISIGKGSKLSIFKRRGSSLDSLPSLSALPEDLPANKATFSRDNLSAAVTIARGKRLSSLEADVSEQLTAFERGTFDLDEEISGLDQKGLVELREQLTITKRECNEEIKRLLHQHYPAFISASKGIRAMDGEMQALRALLNRETALLNTIKEVADPQGRFKDGSQQATAAGETWTRSWADSPEGLRWNDALQRLDIAIAEQRPADALPLLKQAERGLLPGQKSGLYAHSLQSDADLKSDLQAQELAARRKKLADLVTSQIADLPVGSTHMQVATQVLASLSGRAHALKRHLEAHSTHLRKAVNRLLKPQNSGGDADGTEFCSAVAQVFFGAIGAAAEDVTLIFGKDLKDLASVVLVWALSETEACALVLKRNAISPFAAPAGLGPTVACCLLALVHCSALQASNGMCLSPRLLRELWPSCDQVLQRRVKRIIEDVRAAVATEVESIAEKGMPQPTAAGGWPELMQAFPSADLVLDELEAVSKILAVLGGPRVREALSHTFLRVFCEYTNAITANFLRFRDEEGALPKALDDAVEPALEVAHSMVEQFLPELAEPLKARCGEICRLRALYDQLNAFQDALLPPDKETVDHEEIARWSDGEGGPSEEDETDAPGGEVSPKSPKDWRTYHAKSSLARVERASNELAEEDFVLGRKASQPSIEPPLLQPSRSIARMGQIMSQSEGLQNIGRVSERAAQQELVRLNHLGPHRVSANGTAKGGAYDCESELEEMSEELSDYDEADMIAQLTKSR